MRGNERTRFSWHQYFLKLIPRIRMGFEYAHYRLGTVLPPNLFVAVVMLLLLLFSHSVVSDSLKSHGLQPTRLLCPWNFPGKHTGVVAITSSRGSFQPRNLTCISCIGRWVLYCWATREAPTFIFHNNIMRLGVTTFWIKVLRLNHTQLASERSEIQTWVFRLNQKAPSTVEVEFHHQWILLRAMDSDPRSNRWGNSKKWNVATLRFPSRSSGAWWTRKVGFRVR